MPTSHSFINLLLIDIYIVSDFFRTPGISMQMFLISRSRIFDMHKILPNFSQKRKYQFPFSPGSSFLSLIITGIVRFLEADYLMGVKQYHIIGLTCISLITG